MFLSLSGLCLDNFPVGLIRRTAIDGAKAKVLIDLAVEAGSLKGLYEFGPVPDDRKERTFRQIVAALRSIHDIEIDMEIFFSVVEGEARMERQ